MRYTLLATVILIVMSGHASAHTGTDWFLLTHEGKLIRQLDWGKEAIVDVEVEQIYRLKDGKITAFRWADGKPVWTVPSPVAGRWDVYWETQYPGVLLLIDDRKATTKAIHGFDKATGKELYRISLEDYWLPPPYQSGFVLRFQRDWNDLDSLYALKQEALLPWPNLLARFDTRTGKRLWEKPIPPAKEGELRMAFVVPGVATLGKASHYFDPATGEPLTHLKPEATRAVAIRKNVVYSLSEEEAPTLTAHRIQPWEPLWSVKNQKGVRYILRENLPDQLLCATESEVVVIDTQKHRVRSRFPAVGLPYAEIAVTTKAVVVLEEKGYRAVDPSMGETAWRYKSQSECFGLRLVGEQLLTVEDVPADPAAPGVRRDRKYIVTALTAENGKVRWRWQMPELKQFHDGTTVEIFLCKSGIAVTRWWFIGER